MTVKEFLDKQRDWTVVTVSEEVKQREHMYSFKTRIGLKELDSSREEIYTKYENREIEYFYHYYDDITKRIVTCICVTQQNN